MPGLHLELLDQFRDYAQIERVLKPLSETPDYSYFRSWGWVENWLATLPKEVPVKLAVLFSGSTARCAFFLGSTRATRGPSQQRVYRLNRTGNEDYDRIYIGHDSGLQLTPNACTLQQVIDCLPADWDELQFGTFSADGNLPAHMKVTAPYEVAVATRQPAPYVDLNAVRTNPGGHLAMLQPNVRGQVKQANRLYEARGELRCEVAHSLPQAIRIYEELIALHQEWWRKRRQRGVFDFNYFRLFHRRLIENRFATGEIQLMRVSCGAATVGCLYNFAFRGVVYFYQSGFALEEDTRMKPGYVCHMEAIRYCARAGYNKYDFLGGVEGYKERLATHQGQIVWAKVWKSAIKSKGERLLRGSKNRSMSSSKTARVV